MIDQIMDWTADHIVWVLGVVIVFLLVLAIIAVKADDNQWARYSAAHHCEVRGRRQGQTSMGIGVSYDGKLGVATTTTPDQRVYVCDGGEIVIR